MPKLYKSITALLAFTGCISLVITGELNPVFLLPGIALIPGYWRFLKGRPPLPRWLIGSLSLVEVVIVFFDAFIVSGDFLIAIAHMTIVFQALKSFDLREPWDPLQVFFMSLLQLIITSELTLSIAVGGIFIVFLFAMIVAIVLSHFIKEGTLHKVEFKKPLVFISLFAFIATSVFFVAIPRAKGGLWSRRTEKGITFVGFSEKVDFGSFGNALIDSTIAMRAEVSDKRLPLYWKGITLDYFDGFSWKNTLRKKKRIFSKAGKFTIRYAKPEKLTIQKIFIEPMDTAVLFGLGEIVAIESIGRVLYMDEAGILLLPAKINRRFSYTVYSVPYSRASPVESKPEYLQIPDGIEKIAALAQQVAGKADTALAKAKLIEAFLRTNYKYSLTTKPTPEGITPIEDFLFNSKEGFCEHYATAMVLMLRSLGIPARIVTGFLGGEENSYADYIIVRQSNAHSWVEAAIDGTWRRFDPTPAGPPKMASLLFLYLDAMKMNWYRYIIGFSSRDQIMLLRSLTMPVFKMPEIPGIKITVRPVFIVIAIAAFATLTVVFILKISRLKRYPPETKLYLKFKDRVRKKGGKVSPSSTPSEVMHEAYRLEMNPDAVSEFIGIYKEIRFGGRKMDSRIKDKYKSLFSGR
jgi:transglutaminase-like putative cysteine protease